MASETLTKYRQLAEQVGCSWYDPCPICYKCRRKASHLYDQCARCAVPFCGRHSEKTRNQFIKRANFAITVTDEVAEAFKALDQDFCTCETTEAAPTHE